MREADRRINQLNQIIDGANNAYSTKTINKSRKNKIINYIQDIIEEYEDVEKGGKKLSKVSERKINYTAKYGENSDTIANIQQKLYDLGFTSQLVTGYYGDITFNNIAYFQIINNLDVTGWIDSKTYKMLITSDINVLEKIETMQNQSSTLILSKIDIEKGVKVVTVGANQYYDCTEALNEVFAIAANEARNQMLFSTNIINDLIWFKSKVDHKAVWDIKREDSWNITVGTTYPGKESKVMFYGKLYSTSELGNMLYGYVGTAMGIPEEILYMGGGYAAVGIKFIIIENYGDDEDRAFIKEGIDWYNKEH